MPTNIVDPLQWYDYNRDAPLADDLLACWPFWEGMGDTLQDVVSDDQGTLTNMDSATDWVPAENGWGLDFDGGDDVVVTNYTSPFLSVASEFSWEVLVYGRGGGGSTCVFGNRFGGTGSPLQFLKIKANGIEYYNGGSEVSIPVAIPANVWTHCHLIKQGNLVSYYQNGVLVGSDTIAKTMDPNPIYIGAGGSVGQEPASCIVAKAAVYNRALSLNEIQQQLYLDSAATVRPRLAVPLSSGAAGGPFPHYTDQLSGGMMNMGM